MSTFFLATWLQEADMANSLHLMSIFIGVLAISIALLMLGLIIGGAVVSMLVIKEIRKVTDLTTELQRRSGPIMEEVTVISKHTREVLEESRPKIQKITDHLVDMTAAVRDSSMAAKAAVMNVEGTVTDASVRAQKQVAKVDTMISNAIHTTSEVIQSIEHGIRVPVQKITVVANQARFIAEGLFDKIKSMTGGGAASKGSARYSSPVPPPSGNRPGTPGAPSGSTGPREPVAVP